ncbi:hypothetical protein F5Y05DRAFT_75924 [Hypoxylon sp. FL0543]|nr:hypothetical protein F5Y05DRAFT_75924 [Hypoxylon sp. FL0543]
MADPEDGLLNKRLGEGEDENIKAHQKTESSPRTEPTRDSGGILQRADWGDRLRLVGFIFNAPFFMYKALVVCRNFTSWGDMTISDALQLLMGFASVALTILLVGAEAPLLYRRFRGIRATRRATVP